MEGRGRKGEGEGEAEGKKKKKGRKNAGMGIILLGLFRRFNRCGGVSERPVARRLVSHFICSFNWKIHVPQINPFACRCTKTR